MVAEGLSKVIRYGSKNGLFKVSSLEVLAVFCVYFLLMTFLYSMMAQISWWKI